MTDVEDTLERAGLLRPGVAVTLAYTSPATGAVTYANGALASGEPVTAQTSMYAASVTKQLIAALVAQQVLAGQLDLRASISDLLPGLPAWTYDIHVRHLIHHTSGLPATSRVLDVLGLTGEEQLNNVLVLHGIGRVSAPDQPPGRAFVYSNMGYVVLAEIASASVSIPISRLARESLFVPLAMESSRLGAAGNQGMSPVGTRPPDTLGDGGLWTTASDLLIWLDAANHNRLGADLTRMVQTSGHLDDGTPLDYAWGITARPSPAGTTYTHGGHWPGWSAKTVRRPATDTAVALLTTSDDVEAVSQTAVELHEELLLG